MNNLVYRKIKRKNYKEIKLMMNKSFTLENYIQDNKILKTVLNIYLYSCLAEQTFNNVAVIDDEVIGVIMAQTKNKTLYYLIKLYLLSFFKRVNAKKTYESFFGT